MKVAGGETGRGGDNTNAGADGRSGLTSLAALLAVGQTEGKQNRIPAGRTTKATMRNLLKSVISTLEQLKERNGVAVSMQTAAAWGGHGFSFPSSLYIFNLKRRII